MRIPGSLSQAGLPEGRSWYIADDMSMVLDTDVMVAALRSPNGASAELLRQVLVGERTAMASVPLFVEYEAVMSRPEHLKAAGAAVADVQNLLDVLAGVVEPVEIRYLWRPQLTDADDDMVLECAVASGSRYLLTHNVKDFSGTRTLGVHAMTPADFLRLMD